MHTSASLCHFKPSVSKLFYSPKTDMFLPARVERFSSPNVRVFSVDLGTTSFARDATREGATCHKMPITKPEKPHKPAQKIPDIGPIRNLFTSPMNKMITLTNMTGVPSIRASIDGTPVVMRGITKLLKQCFYPTYEYRGRWDDDREAVLPHDRRNRAASKRRKKQGTDRGNEVDYQLRLFANNPKAFAKLGKKLDPRTRDIKDCYFKWGWVPVASQFPVAAPDAFVGTRLDMVAYDLAKRPILIDNKVGFEGYLTKANDFMAEPIQHLANSPINQHFLQLIVEKEIAKRYWGVDFGSECYIVQAIPDGVIPHKISQEILDCEQAIWSTFYEYAKATAKRKDEWKNRDKKMCVQQPQIERKRSIRVS